MHTSGSRCRAGVYACLATPFRLHVLLFTGKVFISTPRSPDLSPRDVFVMQTEAGSLVYTAAYHGNVRHLKKLLQRHAKELDSLLKWPHPHGGATAIYVACEFGHKDAVQLLLEAKAPPDQPREDGATPLYKACQDGKLDIVKLLLKHGAKVDQIDANQMTALWVACHQGHMELAKVLLEAKADPTFKVQDWTPIMLAEREQRNQLVELLLKHAPAGYEE